MIIGISSFTYGWSLEKNLATGKSSINEMDLLEIAVENGISCVQIGDNLPLHKMEDDRLHRLRNAAADHNIRLEIGARGLTSMHLKTYYDLATFFEAPILRFVVDDEGYTPGEKDIIRIIREAIPELEARDIYLGIENHDRLKGRELAQIVESIDHEHVGVCLDCVNSMGAGEGLEQVLYHLAPHTINLHFKDYNIKRLPHKMGFIIEGAIPGEGFLNANLVLDQITRYGRCQSIILEQWVPPEEHSDATIEKEKAWALQGIEFIKNLNNYASP